jgi:hypothetical protein
MIRNLARSSSATAFVFAGQRLTIAGSPITNGA